MEVGERAFSACEGRGGLGGIGEVGGGVSDDGGFDASFCEDVERLQLDGLERWRLYCLLGTGRVEKAFVLEAEYSDCW